MEKICVPGTDIIVSRFAFGTAAIHHIASARRRHGLLFAAVDHGFTHFDTAPYYGFGLAERTLAPLLAARPEITVATKAGLYPPGGGNQSAAMVLARKAAGKIFSDLSSPIVDWSVKRARDSLDASLLRLGRERVDTFFLHEPDLALIATEEWLRWLEDERDRVRTFGVSGEMSRLSTFIDERNPLATVIQTSDSLDRHEADPVLKAGRPLQFTYGYVSAAQHRGGREPRAVLAGALARNATGSIVVSTRRTGRLGQYAEAIAEANA